MGSTGFTNVRTVDAQGFMAAGDTLPNRRNYP